MQFEGTSYGVEEYEISAAVTVDHLGYPPLELPDPVNDSRADR